ncbi:MAG: diaminopimelate epimerase [Pseudomonadota bacterium]
MSRPYDCDGDLAINRAPGEHPPMTFSDNAGTDDLPAPIFDARGNRYAVCTPSAIPGIPVTASQAAASVAQWASQAIKQHCRGRRAATANTLVTDGLIVGPFNMAPPFDILIVNTDGSLAERSGNGLTIFAEALRGDGRVKPNTPFDVHVHHATPNQPNPLSTTLTLAGDASRDGVWVDMGQPAFGPDAVDASQAIAATGTPRRDTNHVAELAELHPLWTDSVLVRVGNPHCVTWLKAADRLPTLDALGRDPFADGLRAIAFAPGGKVRASDAAIRIPPFRAGINLQWAARLANDRVAARIFERGEGLTRSSGSSATAVACAARQLGLVSEDVVAIEMPGGTAHVRFMALKDDAFTAAYLGVAERLAPDAC